MGSSLFLISTLAFLATASAERCITVSWGDTSAVPIPLNDINLIGGLFTVNLPNVCYQLGPSYLLVGTEVTACTPGVIPPIVEYKSIQRFFISTEFGARVSSTIFCRDYSQQYKAGQAGARNSATHSAQVNAPMRRPYAG